MPKILLVFICDLQIFFPLLIVFTLHNDVKTRTHPIRIFPATKPCGVIQTRKGNRHVQITGGKMHFIPVKAKETVAALFKIDDREWINEREK